MIDIYLKAATESKLYAALESAGIVTQGEDGWHVSDGHKYALDVIGEIPDATGYHANLRVINASDFDADTIADIVINTPGSPVRGWA